MSRTNWHKGPRTRERNNPKILLPAQRIKVLSTAKEGGSLLGAIIEAEIAPFGFEPYLKSTRRFRVAKIIDIPGYKDVCILAPSSGRYGILTNQSGKLYGDTLEIRFTGYRKTFQNIYFDNIERKFSFEDGITTQNGTQREHFYTGEPFMQSKNASMVRLPPYMRRFLVFHKV